MSRYINHGCQIVDARTGQIVDEDELLELYAKNIKENYVDSASKILSFGVEIPYRLQKTRSGEKVNVVNVKENYHFAKVYRTDVIDAMNKFELNVWEKGFLFTFLPYLHFPSNSIVVDGKHPDIPELCKMTGVGKSKLYEILSSLESNNIIVREKLLGELVIFFNPFLTSCGLVSLDTYKLFENSIYNPAHKIVNKKCV